MYAAQFGHVDLVHELIQRGSDIYLTNVHDGADPGEKRWATMHHSPDAKSFNP